LDIRPDAEQDPEFGSAEWREKWVTPGTSWAMLDEGKAVAIGGVMTRLPGVGYCWAVFPPGIGYKRLFTAARFCRQEAGVLMSGRFSRLEAVVRRDFGKGVQFARTQGFELEGMARKWDGENDYFLFARVA